MMVVPANNITLPYPPGQIYLTSNVRKVKAVLALEEETQVTPKEDSSMLLKCYHRYFKGQHNKKNTRETSRKIQTYIYTYICTIFKKHVCVLTPIYLRGLFSELFVLWLSVWLIFCNIIYYSKNLYIIL